MLLPGSLAWPATERCRPGKWSECVHHEFSTQHAWISEFLSDSNFFMHDQSEFQCDPFQDRPAEKGLQEWVELEAWPFEALRGTFFPARW